MNVLNSRQTESFYTLNVGVRIVLPGISASHVGMGFIPSCSTPILVHGTSLNGMSHLAWRSLRHDGEWTSGTNTDPLAMTEQMSLKTESNVESWFNKIRSLCLPQEQEVSWQNRWPKKWTIQLHIKPRKWTGQFMSLSRLTMNMYRQ